MNAAVKQLPRLGPADAAVFETFAVPRYLTLFGELALEMLADGDDAQVVHFQCRTGYPDRGLALKLPGAYIFGCDPSPHAIELSRAKAATMAGMFGEYKVMEEPGVAPFPPGAFSHALSLHPLAAPPERGATFRELARLLAPRGQALIALPLRGSFQEVIDLLREFALKTEMPAFAARIEAAAPLRPTAELLENELSQAGFNFVDVERRTASLRFKNGREFLEDPITRLLLLPELRLDLDTADLDRALGYVRDAIDKYWSDDAFELTVNVGCATGRRLG